MSFNRAALWARHVTAMKSESNTTTECFNRAALWARHVTVRSDIYSEEGSRSFNRAALWARHVTHRTQQLRCEHGAVSIGPRFGRGM